MTKEKVTWQQAQAFWQSFVSSLSSLPLCWWLVLSNAPNHQDPTLRDLKMCLWWVRRHNSVMRTRVIMLMLLIFNLGNNVSWSCINLIRVSFLHAKTFIPVATCVVLLQKYMSCNRNANTSVHKCVLIITLTYRKLKWLWRILQYIIFPVEGASE